MTVVAELALVVAVLASAVALAYIMHWWGELHPVTEIVAQPEFYEGDWPGGEGS
jgi:hypothetical protein